MVLAALSLLEGGVRHTSVVDRWVGSPDALAGQAADDAMDSFAALEQGGFTQVPRSGNPVAFPPRGDRTRVVVFGGSEVAGGPWNDGLESYFPARLQDLTGPEVEVLNQGVGDWTTFHIRLHVEQRLAELSPDVLVLYVGHNDLVETLPVSLAELHQHWQVHGTAGDASVLQELRLFQGLRALLAALLDPRLAPAVPVGDAAENLAVLAAASRATGSHMLLVKQGLSPDSGPLAAYHAMLEDLATAQDGVEVLDAATLLQEAGPGHFVDDRHLSTPGALLLAQALHQRLVELGWLPTGP